MCDPAGFCQRCVQPMAGVRCRGRWCFALVLVVGQVIQKAQDGLTAPGGPEYGQVPVIEYQAPHLVTCPECQPGQQSRNLGTPNLFVGAGTGKEQGRPEIDNQQYRSLPLFLVQLGVWCLAPGRYPPVYTANVITGLVLAHFGKRHSAPFLP